MPDGMKTKEARELWAKDLEEHPELQGEGQLATPDGKFCCLGRAAQLAVNHGVIDGYEPGEGSLNAYPAVMLWLGLATPEGDYLLAEDEDWDACHTLTADNDNGVSFPRIAATIRAEPPGLFDV